MVELYETPPAEVIDMEWRGIPLRASVKTNWLGSGTYHVELKADRPLPVTETGYRSHFVMKEDYESFGCLQDFVTCWLNIASDSRAWARIQEVYAQPDLID